MANAAQNAPKIQLGKLTPEEAERLASTFRPVWELDDAPFAQGSMSAADVDALSGGAGVAPSIRNTEARQNGIAEPSTAISVTTELKSFPGHVPAPDAPKVEIAVDPEPPPPPAPVVAQAAPQAPPVPRKPFEPPRAPAPTVRVHRDVVSAAGSGEFVPVKKSNVGLIAAGVGVIVLIGAIFGIRAAMSDTKTQTASTSTATTTTQEETTHIPPPPVDTTPVVAATAPAQTAQQAAPPVQTAAPQVANAVTAPTHAVTTNVTAPVVHNTPPAHTTAHVTTGATHPSGGHATIVRDNPF